MAAGKVLPDLCCGGRAIQNIACSRGTLCSSHGCDDLAALLKQRAPEFGLPFKQVVNQALRVGLGAQAKPRARTVPRTLPQAFAIPGRVADAPRPDKIAVVIAISDAGRPHPRVGKGRI